MSEEQKEYYTLVEASQYAGIKRATVYNYLHDLGIVPQKFGRQRHGYITRKEMEMLKDYKERPWKYERKQKPATEESVA